MSNSFKIPFALETKTGTNKSAHEVPNGLACECICPICSEKLIAANEGSKKAAHFKHQKNSDCSVNGESYLHYHAKQTILRHKSIVLPPISSHDPILEIDFKSYRARLTAYIEKLAKCSTELAAEILNLAFESNNFSFRNIILNESKILYFDNVKDEVRVKINGISTTIPDIIGILGNREIFIEPYLTNPINEFKRDKLIERDVSTISINLKEYIFRNDWAFTLEDYEKFIIHDVKSKKWETLSSIFKSRNLKKFESEIIQNIEWGFKNSKESLQRLIDNKNKIEMNYKKIQHIRIDSHNLELENKTISKDIIGAVKRFII